MGIIVIKIYKRVLSVLKKILWKLIYLSSFRYGKKTIFYPGTRITIDGNGILRIGSDCFFNHGCSINAMKEISIGNNCIFGENVKFYDHNHSTQKNGIIKNQGYVLKKIKIGNNCWFGSNVIVLPGVTVGDNVIVGAGTIVTKSIESNSTVVSNIKNRII